jgi:hypothetical protein
VMGFFPSGTSLITAESNFKSSFAISSELASRN